MKELEEQIELLKLTQLRMSNVIAESVKQISELISEIERLNRKIESLK